SPAPAPRPRRQPAVPAAPAQQAEQPAVSGIIAASRADDAAEPAYPAPSSGFTAQQLPAAQAQAEPVSAASYSAEPAVAAWRQQQEHQVQNKLQDKQQGYAAALDAETVSTQASQKALRKTVQNGEASRAGLTPALHRSAAPTAASGFDLSVKTPAGSAPAPPLKLPGGLPPLSTVRGERLLLAVDLAGNLYLSSDAGAHWESVARQWTGRAVQLRLAAPAPGFELVTDGGLAWASADGATWTAK
ncbi:MAG: hypothetical protein WCE75_07055, partial [Terracidiphilus sp.]